MHDLSRLVSNNQTLGTIADLFDEGTYLVGGCIRDMLLGTEPSDFDVVTFRDVWQTARCIGERLGGKTFWMDRDRGVVRIALKPSDQTIDISTPKGTDLAEDLKKRDITINAMGYDMRAGKLIDPTGGLSDLGHGIIRCICEENIKDDPLRVVRCIRFCVMLGFAMAQSTASLLNKYAPAVSTVSPERIKQECMKALDCPFGARFFSLLDRAGLLEVLFDPDSSSGHGRGVRQALAMAIEMDGLIYDADRLLPGSPESLGREVEAGLSRAGLLRLVTVVYGMGLPWDIHEGTAGTIAIEEGLCRADAVCRSLRFSTNARAAAMRIIAGQAAVSDMLGRDGPPRRSLHMLCREAEPFLPEVLLLARAIHRGLARMNELLDRAWNYQTHTYLEHKRSALITGEDVMNTLGLAPGPRVGRVLQAIEMARADGMVSTRRDALDYLLAMDE